MICRINTLFPMVFPNMDKNYKKFPDHSRFSLTSCKNGLFSRFSRFSRFSMNPVSFMLLNSVSRNLNKVIGNYSVEKPSKQQYALQSSKLCKM